MEENTQTKTILRHNAFKIGSATFLHPRGMTMGACPHKQQLHWYLSALVALSPPNLSLSHLLVTTGLGFSIKNMVGLIFMSPGYRVQLKIYPNPKFNSNPIVTKS